MAACLALSLVAAASQAASWPQTPESDRANHSHRRVNNIVLIHGAWADGSSWSKVIPILEARGFNVVAAQLPLSSLEEDDAAAERAIARLVAVHPGPVLLVGHSYGGVVIGDTPGHDPNVVGLVYVAAFAPNTGQSALGLLSTLPTPPPINEFLVFNDAKTSVTISSEGIAKAFAQNLDRHEQLLLDVTQGPTAAADLTATPTVAPAWQTKPSWFIVSAQDKAITAPLEEQEAAEIGAVETVILPTCHVAMLEQPERVSDVIIRAAEKLGR